MNKKHIVIVENTEIGGHLALSTFLTGLLKKYTHNSKFHYSLICGYIDKLDQIGDIAQHINIIETKTSYNKIKDNLLFTLRALKNLRKLHKQKSIDVIHCLYPNSSLQAAFLFKILGHRNTKIIYDVRSPRIEMSFANSWISKSKMRIKHMMHASERLLCKFVDYFVFISKGTQNYYTTTYHLHKSAPVSIIPTGVEVRQFENHNKSISKKELQIKLYGEKIKEYDHIIGYIGTISKMRKMVEYLEQHIDAVKKSNTYFVMIGNGDDWDNLQLFIKKHHLEGQFFAPGKMKQSELIEYMHSFDYGRCHLPDIFVFRNSFPLKILEYMSAGIPVLASTIKTHNELASTHPSIYLYNEQKNIFDTITISTEIKKEDKQELIRKYDRSSLYSDYLAIYKKLTE